MKKNSCLFASQKGQALLIVLLVMAVVLTIGLSLVSRSITDITISQKEEESARAFSAAEAGIERALIEAATGGIISGRYPDTGGEYVVGSAEQLGGGPDFILPTQVASGEVVPVWLVAHDENGDIVCDDEDNPCFIGSSLKICWGEEGTLPDSSTTPSIEASVFYKNGLQIKIGRGAFDPNSTRMATNQFASSDSGTCTIGSTDFAFSKTITFGGAAGDLAPRRQRIQDEDGPQIARIRFFYNTDRAHPVGVQVTGGNLPPQGTKIVSTGTVGDITRKIEVSRLFEDLPSVFDSGLFSGAGGIVKSE